ncbi:unnamed protein product [Adineta steineri]|uniref:NHL repeat containing protein n=1 Tax=Adineta steineri TaxID=433720 RepID=A0A818Y5T3_9BILA|nr:unnamed protein product [Adineta steineri]
MADNAALLSQKELGNISLVATHDSGTYNLTNTLINLDSYGPPFTTLYNALDTIANWTGEPLSDLIGLFADGVRAASKCTTKDIYSQLCDGNRGLDLRLSVYNGNIYMAHVLQGPSLSTVLADVMQFLNETTGEVVYITAGHPYGFNQTYINLLASLLNPFVQGGFAITPAAYPGNLLTYTYGQLVNNGRSRVIIVLDDTINPNNNSYFSASTYSPPDGGSNKLCGFYTDSDNITVVITNQTANYIHCGTIPAPAAIYMTLTPSTGDTAVQIESQICEKTAQYGECSTNNACGCFHMLGANDGVGICGFLWPTCSRLVPCNSSDNSCLQSNTICVQHPQCDDRPLCYPVTMMNENICPPMINKINLKWKLNFSIVAGGNGGGNDLNQVTTARGIYIDDDKQTIYITQYNSDRIVGWKFGEESGEIVAGGNGHGDEINQLHNPSDVTVDKKNDLLIICDQGNERVVQWSRQKQIDPRIIIAEIKCNGVTIDNNGDIYISEGETHSVIRFKQGEAEVTTVAGGNGYGYEPNQLNNPAYIFVDEQYSIYVSDHEYGRVTKWIKNAKEGIIVAKEQIPDGNIPPSFYSSGMAVDHFGNVYVSEPIQRRIVRWSEGSKEGYVVMNGGNYEHPPILFDTPAAISLDREGNLILKASVNARIKPEEMILT